MEYTIIIIVAIVIYLFIKNFTKRKLAFIGLSTSFALTIIPCIVSGISAKYPSDGDALGGGFLMLFAIYMVILSLFSSKKVVDFL